MTKYKLVPIEPTREMIDAGQPVDKQPVSWIRIRGDHVILSRCDWIHPASAEDSAGPRDEQRFTAVGNRDGDIVLPAPEGALDREDLKTMLAWPNDSKPAEQQPDASALVEALEEMIDVAQRVDGWESFPSDPIERAQAALAAYHDQGGGL